MSSPCSSDNIATSHLLALACCSRVKSLCFLSVRCQLRPCTLIEIQRALLQQARSFAPLPDPPLALAKDSGFCSVMYGPGGFPFSQNRRLQRYRGVPPVIERLGSVHI